MHRFMTQGIDLEELTPAFRQAIAVTRLLKVEYLWIDSLCIIQGKGGDFPVEGHLMHQVYRKSFCNIAAADSRDGSEGLFRDKRDPHRVIPARYIASGDSATFGREVWRVVPASLWDEQLLGAVMYTRAWVFQGELNAVT